MDKHFAREQKFPGNPTKNTTSTIYSPASNENNVSNSGHVECPVQCGQKKKPVREGVSVVSFSSENGFLQKDNTLFYA